MARKKSHERNAPPPETSPKRAGVSATRGPRGRRTDCRDEGDEAAHREQGPISVVPSEKGCWRSVAVAPIIPLSLLSRLGTVARVAITRRRAGPPTFCSNHWSRWSRWALLSHRRLHSPTHSFVLRLLHPADVCGGERPTGRAGLMRPNTPSAPTLYALNSPGEARCV